MPANLFLIRDCLRGDAAAWETLVLRYRAQVYAFALSLTKEEAAARDIASAMWADLYGVRTNASGVRLSKLASYSGRGSLEGWLRTLVAQAYVDRYRTERRYVPLEEGVTLWARVEENAVEAADNRLEQALDRALSELGGEQRLILSAQYLDGRTFAEIGGVIGAHESSVCRQSKKIIAFVRKRTLHYLRLSGMSMREAQEMMESDVRGISLDVRKRLQLLKNTP